MSGVELSRRRRPRHANPWPPDQFARHRQPFKLRQYRYFCLWEGYGNIDTSLYKAGSRVSAPGRDYLLFSGPMDSVISFLASEGPFWGDSPSIWWPEDRAWCVATGIDLFDTYVGGSSECIEAILSCKDLEALPTTLDARLDIGGDTINVPSGS